MSADVYVDMEVAAHAGGVSLSTIKRLRRDGLLRTRPGGLVSLHDVWEQTTTTAKRNRLSRASGLPPTS